MTQKHPPENRRKLALFDLDHTLLPLDSDFEWGQYTARKGLVESDDFAQRNAEFFRQYREGSLDLGEYVMFATEAIRRLGPEASLAARDDFMKEVIEPAILPQALDLLQSHRQAGAEILLVTATNDFITEPIARALEIEHLLAVSLARDDNGWYSGLITGVPTLREGKVTRVDEWLTRRGWDWSDVHTTFYSDSSNDIALLEKVDVPIATNPDERLRAHARLHGWQCLDLFEQ